MEPTQAREPADLGPALQIVEQFSPVTSNSIIPLLQRLQDAYGYLPREVVLEVCERTGLPASRVFGVATFYSQFHLKPRARHLVRCCRGTACHVKGGKRIGQAIQRESGRRGGRHHRRLAVHLRDRGLSGHLLSRPGGDGGRGLLRRHDARSGQEDPGAIPVRPTIMPRRRLDAPSDLERLREAARAGRKALAIARAGLHDRLPLAGRRRRWQRTFREKVAAAGLQDEVAVVDVGCHGQCALAPVVVIEPQQLLLRRREARATWTRSSRPRSAAGSRWNASANASTDSAAATVGEAPFYRRQQRDVLGHCGRHRSPADRRRHRPRHLRRHGEGPDRDEAGRGHRRSARVRPAGTRRRRIPHRHEVGPLPQGARRREIRHLQRRRGRSRGVHGSRSAGRRPAPGDRRHGDRRLRHRRVARLRLCPRRVSDRRRAHEASPWRRPASAAFWARTSSAAGSTSTSSARWARALSSAARRAR